MIVVARSTLAAIISQDKDGCSSAHEVTAVACDSSITTNLTGFLFPFLSFPTSLFHSADAPCERVYSVSMSPAQLPLPVVFLLSVFMCDSVRATVLIVCPSYCLFVCRSFF